MRLPNSKLDMGFCDTRAFNQALLAKQACHLIDTPDSLHARLLRAKYYPHSNLMDTVFSDNTSTAWKGIMHGLDLVKQGLTGGWGTTLE